MYPFFGIIFSEEMSNLVVLVRRTFMRLTATKFIKPGTKLAKTIYNENGQILLQAGMELSGKMLARLLQQNFTYIYIKEKMTEGIVATPAISEQLQIESSERSNNPLPSFKRNAIWITRLFLKKPEKRWPIW